MVSKLLPIIGLIVLIGIVLLFIYKEGENKGQISEINKNQEIDIKIKNEIIEDQRKITVRKSINRSVSTNDNLEWLRKNRCKDCQSR